MNYEEEYIRNQKVCDIKIGDRVRVKGGVPSHSQGWGDNWIAAMDYCVGNVYKVDDIDPVKGIRLKGSKANRNVSRDYYFPYFVLEIVRDEENEYRRIVL